MRERTVRDGMEGVRSRRLVAWLAVGSWGLLAACAVGKEPPTPTPMVRLAAGVFMFGPEEPCYHDGDNPCTAPDGSWQRLSKANPYPSVPVAMPEFYLDAFEVTNVQYAYCVAMGGCEEPVAVNAPDLTTQGDYYNDSRFANYPVVQVTWQMARDYCAFVGKRLPTELEWERAAKGLSTDECDDATQKCHFTPGRVYPADEMASSTDHEDCIKWALPTRFCAPGGSEELQPEPEVGADGTLSATTNDFVTERDENGTVTGTIYYLFGNASEWTADPWREHPSCAAPPPCVPCWACKEQSNVGQCESICATCTTCIDAAGTNTCHFACDEKDGSESVESVVCSIYALEEGASISPDTIEALSVDDSALRVIRGGNVTDGKGWGCLARSAGRDRVKTNPAYVPTQGFPEVGFRCAADAPPANP